MEYKVLHKKLKNPHKETDGKSRDIQNKAEIILKEILKSK